MPHVIQPAPVGRMVDAKGLAYHVIEMGEGPPTFFLHGGGPGCTAWSDFGPVAPLFAAERACYLVDLLQYGKSEKCTITGPMWDFHAKTICDLMDALGIERADFVCNSWGGTIALNLAAIEPGRSSSPDRCRSSTGRLHRCPTERGAAARRGIGTSGDRTARRGRRCAS